MPTYAYRCTACSHEFEAVQKFSDDPLKTCPDCGAPIKRVIFPAGIVFKGDGWYITDSRKGGETKDKSGGSAKPSEKPAAETKESSPTPAPVAEAKSAKAAD